MTEWTETDRPRFDRGGVISSRSDLHRIDPPTPLDRASPRHYHLRGFPRVSGTVSMMTPTEHRYVVRDDQILGGEPIIKGTRTPVRAIVETWRLGVAPEEIPVGM